MVRHRPPLLFWSNASDQGWGDHLHDQFVLGLWSDEERSLSIILRELHAICLGLMHFSQPLQGMTVGVFTDNTTAVLCQETRGDVRGAQPGGATSSPLGGVHRPLSGSPIYCGVPERCSRLPEPSTTGPRLRMDPGSGGRGRVCSEVAGDSRSVRHCPELPAPGLFLSPLRSYGSGYRCLSSGLG